MPRAGLKALGTVLSGVPKAQAAVSTSMYNAEVSQREKGRYEMDKEKFEIQKQAIKDDKNFYENIYAWVSNDPKYGAYANQIKQRIPAYKNDPDGKDKTMKDVAKLKHMVDTSLDNPDSGLVPNLDMEIKEWNENLKNLQAGSITKGLQAPIEQKHEIPKEQWENQDVTERAAYRGKVGLGVRDQPTAEQAHGVALGIGAGKGVAESVAGSFIKGTTAAQETQANLMKLRLKFTNDLKEAMNMKNVKDKIDSWKVQVIKARGDLADAKKELMPDKDDIAMKQHSLDEAKNVALYWTRVDELTRNGMSVKDASNQMWGELGSDIGADINVEDIFGLEPGTIPTPSAGITPSPAATPAATGQPASAPTSSSVQTSSGKRYKITAK